MILWQLFWTITVPSVALLLIATYAMRIFEYPAMARQSLYFWDQCWLVPRARTHTHTHKVEGPAHARTHTRKRARAR